MTQQKEVTDAFEALNGFSVVDAAVPIVNSVINSFYLAALAVEKGGVYDGTAARDSLRDIANAPGQQVVGTVDFASALSVVQAGNDLDYVGLTSAIEYDANGDFPSNVAEVKFNATGTFDLVQILQPGVDF